MGKIFLMNISDSNRCKNYSRDRLWHFMVSRYYFTFNKKYLFTLKITACMLLLHYSTFSSYIYAYSFGNCWVKYNKQIVQKPIFLNNFHCLFFCHFKNICKPMLICKRKIMKLPHILITKLSQKSKNSYTFTIYILK